MDRDFDRDASLEVLLQKAQSTLELRNRCSRSRDLLYDGLRPLAEFLERVQRARTAGRFDANLVENEILWFANNPSGVKVPPCGSPKIHPLPNQAD